MDNSWGKKVLIGVSLSGIYYSMEKVAKKYIESDDINKKNPYLQLEADEKYKISAPTFYEKIVKPVADKTLSFGILVGLFPLYLLIALAIYLDDPGPVIFKQKRVGKDKCFFYLHKFRSMKMSTPHDTPTHELKNPDEWITRVGGFLRKTSLDELPQMWDIFRGRMSMVGPRPALWNQENLVAERDKYGVNRVLPGLTGWAQVNGRDELTISDKAALDGDYTRCLKKGGWSAVSGDFFCFFKTIYKVLSQQGVVEGKAEELNKNNFQDYGINELYAAAAPTIRKDTSAHNKPEKVLIVGKGSYIGTSVERYLCGNGREYIINTLDTINFQPEVSMFQGYDAVFYVAGIVHRKETKKNKALYYKINRDLAIKVAQTAKKAQVPYFILMSSMAVYGMEEGHITKSTKENPKNHYGRSKLQADEAIWSLRDDAFRIAILRPPMVYGEGCKGNYNMLRKIAMKCPVFPKINNKHSMIYIGNLCEFVKKIIDIREEGIFFPQNETYVNTSEMVKRVALDNGKRIREIRAFNPIIKKFRLKIVRKAFGNLTYEKTDTIKKYKFDDSIAITESRII